MSINHSVINYFGLYFDNSEAALEFLKDNKVTDYQEEIEGSELGMTCLNFFTGEGCALGYEMKLGDTVEKYALLWQTTFPNSTLTPEINSKVRTW